MDGLENLKIDPEKVKGRVMTALDADPGERKMYMKRKILKTTLIAAAITAVCTSAVFAATPAGQEAINSIISYFQNEKATEMTSMEELAKYNEEIGASVTKDGVTLTLDNVAADDNFVHVFYTVTSDTPFYRGDDPLAPNAMVEENQWCIECVIDGDLAGGRNHSSIDGYFVDQYTYKAAGKYNVAPDEIPEQFKVELYMGDYDSAAMLKLYKEETVEITSEEMTDIWYVSAEVDKSAVEVESCTKEINKRLPSGAIIDKVIFSPFGNQLVVHTEPNGDDIPLFDAFALYDENDVCLDILNTGLSWNSDGSSVNSFEFLKAGINTKQLKIVPVKWTLHDSEDRQSNVIEKKIGQYPLRYDMRSGSSVVVTDIRFSDGKIEIDYYTDGYIPADPGFDLMNDAGENAEPGGKLGCILYTDVHHETNSYTARYVYDAWDEDGNRIPPNESVSADTLRSNFTTLGVCDTNDTTLDFDNAITVNLN